MKFSVVFRYLCLGVAIAGVASVFAGEGNPSIPTSCLPQESICYGDPNDPQPCPANSGNPNPDVCTGTSNGLTVDWHWYQICVERELCVGDKIDESVIRINGLQHPTVLPVQYSPSVVTEAGVIAVNVSFAYPCCRNYDFGCWGDPVGVTRTVFIKVHEYVRNGDVVPRGGMRRIAAVMGIDSSNNLHNHDYRHAPAPRKDVTGFDYGKTASTIANDLCFVDVTANYYTNAFCQYTLTVSKGAVAGSYAIASVGAELSSPNGSKNKGYGVTTENEALSVTFIFGTLLEVSCSPVGNTHTADGNFTLAISDEEQKNPHEPKKTHDITDPTDLTVEAQARINLSFSMADAYILGSISESAPDSGKVFDWGN
ncbi:MAG: hypothetical protein RLY93_12525 [Sumerlaeia bacterium]